MALLYYFALPILASWARRRIGTIHWMNRFMTPYFLGALLLWIIMLLRVVHFLLLLQDVLDRDNTLERLASNMIYLETTKQYLDRTLFLWLPMVVLVQCVIIKIA